MTISKDRLFYAPNEFFEGQLISPVPHTCPVCNGRGNVPSGFYNHYYLPSSNTTTPIPCQTCNGSGIVKLCVHV